MINLLRFPPAILLFLGAITLIALLADSVLKGTWISSKVFIRWLHRFITLSLGLCLLWSTLLYPEKTQWLLSEHFVWSQLTSALSISLLALSLLTFMFLQDDTLNEQVFAGDYYVLTLLSIFGALSMLTGGSMLAVYLGLEITSLATYGIVSLNTTTPLRIEAIIKYVITGMLASVFMLYGLSLLYGHYQTLILVDGVANHSLQLGTLSLVGASFVFASFLFKLGAAPFHFWVPDIYYTSPTVTILPVASFLKFSAIGMGIKLFSTYLYCLTTKAQMLVIAVGLLSTISGSLLVIHPTHLKRLVAYSSIGQMGWVIMGLALPTHHHPSIIFYGFTYCYAVVLLLGTLLYLERHQHNIEDITDLKGLGIYSPLSAFSIFVAISTIVGMPPSVGFFSKLGLIKALVLHQAYSAAAIASICTITSIYYYLRVIKQLYFTEELQEIPASLQKAPVRSQAMIGISATTLLLSSLFCGSVIDSLYQKLTVFPSAAYDCSPQK